jgi:hypothetical protein
LREDVVGSAEVVGIRKLGAHEERAAVDGDAAHGELRGPQV